MHALSLTASLMLFWVMISGDPGALNLSLGLLSALLVVWIAHRMDVVDEECLPLPLMVTTRLPVYWAWLAIKVVKSNLAVTRCVWTPGRCISPTMLRLRMDQQSALGKVIYANSVTLTPGTVTMAIDSDRILVHALCRADAAELESGELNRRVRQLECGCLPQQASRS